MVVIARRRCVLHPRAYNNRAPMLGRFIQTRGVTQRQRVSGIYRANGFRRRVSAGRWFVMGVIATTSPPSF